jgi:hypothetical protein
MLNTKKQYSNVLLARRAPGIKKDLIVVIALLRRSGGLRMVGRSVDKHGR